jgi:5-methylcytosine-specific restriction endonuclease McrA
LTIEKAKHQGGRKQLCAASHFQSSFRGRLHGCNLGKPGAIMEGPIDYQVNPTTVQALVNFYKQGALNLEPVFQRASVWSRNDRRKLVESILRNYPIELKDSKRLFTQEQRRILWNTTSNRKCQVCGEQLSWRDFTIDHIDPFSKGGRTRLDNAALLCRKHNAAKGAKRKQKAA